MRTAYCPEFERELASERAGTRHIPGRHYHSCDVVVSLSSDGMYRVHVVESWGKANWQDDEHGRREVVASGETLESAISEAKSRASFAKMDEGYLAQAISRANDAAVVQCEYLAATNWRMLPMPKP